MRFGAVPIPIFLPLRCVEEIAEGFCDIASLFRRFSKKINTGVSVFDNLLRLIREQGPLDLVDVDVTNPDSRVKIKILLR